MQTSRQVAAGGCVAGAPTVVVPGLPRPSKARLAGRWGRGARTSRIALVPQAVKAVVESMDVISSLVGSPNPAVP